jgi:hypothetical protein
MSLTWLIGGLAGIVVIGAVVYLLVDLIRKDE